MPLKLPLAQTGLASTILLVWAFLPQHAAAAQNEADSDGPLEEIVVTTQKRAQSVLDVPLTITTYSGQFLKDLGIDEFDEISDITPGLVIQEQSPNNPGFVIRGITSDSGSAQIAPRVSIYLNGVDVSRSRGSHFEMFDIERIEVAKGPQATLFGNAASIGAVSVITAKPEQEFGAEATFAYGNFDTYIGRGHVTGGNDIIQGRLAVSYRKRDGYIENIAGEPGSQTAGGFDQADLNGIERFAVRPSIRLTPNENLLIDLVLNYEKNDDTGTSFKSGVFAPTGGSTDPFSFAELAGSPFSEQALGARGLGIDRELYDANLTIAWDVNETVSFTSITGYRDFDSLEIFDADGFQAFYLEFAEDAEGDQFSQEFRVNLTGDRLQGFFGVSFFHEDGSQAVPFSTEEGTYLQCAAGIIPGLPCVNPDGSVNSATPFLGIPGVTAIPYQLVFGNTGNFDTYSAFFDATYALTEKLEVSAGIRAIFEKRRSGYFADAPASVITGAPLLPTVDTGGQIVSVSDNFDGYLPRFNVLYQATPDINLYGTISKGRRSNVLDVNARVSANGNVLPTVNEIPAEIIWNFEGGVKGTLFENRADFSLGVFYQDYENFQVSVQREDGSFVTQNAGNASNLGVEAEIRGSVTDSLSLFANIAWIEAEIDNDPANGVFAGNRFRLQPEWTAAAGFFYDQPIGEDFKIIANGTWTWRSDVFFEPENQPIAGLPIAEGDIHQVNARLGFGDADDRWTIVAYATNLFDENFIIDAGNTGGIFGTPTFIAGPPRFYGVELTGRF